MGAASLPVVSAGYTPRAFQQAVRPRDPVADSVGYESRLLALDMTGPLVEELLASRLCARYRREHVVAGMEAFAAYQQGRLRATDLVRGCAYILRGLNRGQIEDEARSLRPKEGAVRFIRDVKERGFVVGIVTSDMIELANYIAQELGIPEGLVRGNVSVYERDIHTGRFEEPIIADEGKIAAAAELQEAVGAVEVVFVGNDRNDGSLLSSTRSIAFNAPPEVWGSAGSHVEGGFEDLIRVLP